MSKLDPHIKTKWLEALRSGEYTQGSARLRKLDDSFCCLGVLCDVYWKETKGGVWSDDNPYGWTFTPVNSTNRMDYSTTNLPLQIQYEMGFPKEEISRLMEMNDIFGKSFMEIADYVESNL